MQITEQFIRLIAPSARAEIVSAIVAEAGVMTDHGITDPTDIAYFFGQSATETAGFNALEENLYYTAAERLMQVWPSKFKTAASAAPYVRQPEKLANFVYGGRLGNTKPNDGYDFRGSGLMQTTGFTNFHAVQIAIGLDITSTSAKADTLRTMPSAFEAACIYWQKNNLSRFSQAGDLVGLTKAIQGATGGLSDRKVFTDRALRALKSVLSPVVTDTSHWLRFGSTDQPAVLALQKLLVILGYYKGGALDGVFGDGTEDAVKHFQSDHGLTPVDGVVGDGTNKALASAAATIAASPSPAPDRYTPQTPSSAPVAPVQGDGRGKLMVVAGAVALALGSGLNWLAAHAAIVALASVILIAAIVAGISLWRIFHAGKPVIAPSNK